MDVEVLDVDLDRERVSLSLKATQEDPWREFERKYQTGEVIDGQVTKLVPFGAFVRVAEGIEGLVHISELSTQHVESPEQVLSVGQAVRVKVVDVDVMRRRISLSIKRVGDEPEIQPRAEIEAEAVEEEAPPAEAAPADEAESPAAEAAPAEVGEVEPEPAEAAPAEEPAARADLTEEEVTLEAILEDLKRREGRT